MGAKPRTGDRVGVGVGFQAGVVVRARVGVKRAREWLRTFLPPVLVLEARAGRQVLRDRHGLVCLLRHVVDRWTVPA